MMIPFQKSSSSYVHRRLQHLATSLQIRDVLDCPKVENCLSFGCATGEELLTLRAMFPEATIHGCDINEHALRIAQGAWVGLNGGAFHSDWDEIRRRGPYDMIFANAVFCYHHQSIKIDDLTPHLPFSQFVDAVGRLIDSLRPGGVIMMRDTTYPLACTPFRDIMVPMQMPGETWSGMVERFGPDGLKYGKRHLTGHFESFEVIRDLPASFEESLLDAVWIKRADHIRGNRFKIERVLKPEAGEMVLFGRYTRDMRNEVRVSGNLTAQTLDLSLHRTGDGSVVQTEERKLIRTSDASVLFTDYTLGVMDLSNGIVTPDPRMIDTSFWSQPEGGPDWQKIFPAP